MDLPLEWHISPMGLSDVVLNDLLHHTLPYTSDFFLGTYPHHDLPPMIPASFRPRFAMIINVGSHFVTLYCNRHFALYIDSLGRPCPHDSVRKFLEGVRGRDFPMFFSRQRIQDSKSSACGLFACLFVLYLFLHNLDRPPVFRMHFSKKDMKSNDKKCIEYIRRCASIILNQNYE